MVLINIEKADLDLMVASWNNYAVDKVESIDIQNKIAGYEELVDISINVPDNNNEDYFKGLDKLVEKGRVSVELADIIKRLKTQFVEVETRIENAMGVINALEDKCDYKRDFDPLIDENQLKIEE